MLHRQTTQNTPKSAPNNDSIESSKCLADLTSANSRARLKFKTGFVGVNVMSLLKNRILARLKCRFYMQLPDKWQPGSGDVKTLLDLLAPIHVVVATRRSVVVDGLVIPSRTTLRKKRCAIDKAVEEMYGSKMASNRLPELCELAVNEAGIYTVTERYAHDENLQTFFLSVPRVPIIDSRLQLLQFLPELETRCKQFLYQTTDKIMQPRIPMSLIGFRFEVRAELSNPYFEPDYQKTLNNCEGIERPLENCLVGTVICHSQKSATLNVSKLFYKKPTLKNVVTFGDLCFLSQMRKNWALVTVVHPFFRLHPNVSTSHFPPSYYVAEVLKRTVGIKSFRSYCCTRKLLSIEYDDDAEEIWREVSKAVGATR